MDMNYESVHRLLQKEYFNFEFRVVCAVEIIALKQKAKRVFIAVTVYTNQKTNNLSCFRVRKYEKDYEKKVIGDISQLTGIDAIDSSNNPINDFEIKFGDGESVKYSACHYPHKIKFLNRLLKLFVESYPEKHLPLLVHGSSRINFPSEVTAVSLKSFDDGSTTDFSVSTTTDVDVDDMTNLKKLINEANQKVFDAEELIELWTKQMDSLDMEHVNEMVGSDEAISTLLNYFDSALMEVERLEQVLENYDSKLQKMGTYFAAICSKDMESKLINKNQERLLHRLSSIANMLDLNDDYEHLKRFSLSSVNSVSKLEKALIHLHECLQSSLYLPQEITKMVGIKEQVENLDQLKKESLRRISEDMRMAIKRASAHDNVATVGLVFRNECPRSTVRFSGLLKQIKILKNDCFDEIADFYIATRESVYGSFSQFFNAVNIKTNSCHSGYPDNSLEKSASVASFTSNTTPRLKKKAPDVSDEIPLPAGSHIKELFAYVFEQFSTVFHKEEEYLNKIFGFPVAESTVVQKLSQETQVHLGSDIPRPLNLLKKLFDVFCRRVNEWAVETFEMSSLNGIYFFAAVCNILDKVDPSSYFADVLLPVYKKAEYQFQESNKVIFNRIKDRKVSEKKRATVYSFVNDCTAHLAATISLFDVNSTFKQILFHSHEDMIQLVFDKIETASADFPKIEHVLKLENYRQIEDVLRRNQTLCLNEELRIARTRYSECRDLYVLMYITVPITSLTKFIEQIKLKLSQGIPAKEIKFQRNLSHQEMRKVIEANGIKEVEKGLRYLQDKVNKHLSGTSETHLMAIWGIFQRQFLELYENIQRVINECYGPNLQLDFTQRQIVDFFSKPRDK